jgi:hypothetical protein
LKSVGYNLDNLEELEAAFGGGKKFGDDAKPVKKAPPKLSSQTKKVVKEEVKGEDVEMMSQYDEEPKVMPKKMPAKAKEAPKVKEEKKGEKVKVSV